MCERFAFQIPSAIIAQTLGLKENPTVPPRYNIAPTQQVPVIRQYADGQNYLDYLHWGVIPSNVNSRAFGRRMYNARSETVTEKSAFCKLVRCRRCLILGSGYYEWILVGTSNKPMYVKLKETNSMVMAGLWGCWRSTKGEIVESCAILTTNSSLTIKSPRNRLRLTDSYQHRMPVILRPYQYQTWLNYNIFDTTSFLRLLRPNPYDLIEIWPVSPLVNNLKNDSVDFVNPVKNQSHRSY